MGVQSKFDFDTPFIMNEITEAVARGVSATNIELQSRIKIKLSQPGSGNLRSKGGRASLAGQPPAPLTGDLRRSFTTAGMSRVTKEGKVIRGTVGQGSGLANVKKYAAALEYGYTARNLQPRPYLQPVVNEARTDDVAAILIRYQVEITAAELNEKYL